VLFGLLGAVPQLGAGLFQGGHPVGGGLPDLGEPPGGFLSGVPQLGRHLPGLLPGPGAHRLALPRRIGTRLGGQPAGLGPLCLELGPGQRLGRPRPGRLLTRFLGLCDRAIDRLLVPLCSDGQPLLAVLADSG
jgi:hypothetical protein